MRYIGIPCESCGNIFNEGDDVVVCPVCGAPHHRECWLKTEMCARNAEHENGFVWVSPVSPEPEKDVPEKKPTPLKNGEEMKICPNCGTENYANDMYCFRCGTKMSSDPGRDYNDFNRDGGFNRRELYEDFNRFGGLDPNSLVDGIPVCECSDYIGGKAPGRIIRKISTAERFGKSVSWMLPAFLFGPIWFFYRKMKKEGLIISIILLLLGTASGLLQINDAFIAYTKGIMQTVSSVREGEIPLSEFSDRLYELLEQYQSAEISGSDRVKLGIGSLLEYIVLIGCPVCCSMFGLSFYRKKIKKDISDIRNKCSDMDTYRNTLILTGGTSPGLAAAGAVLALMVFLSMNYLPSLIALFK